MKEWVKIAGLLALLPVCIWLSYRMQVGRIDARAHQATREFCEALCVSGELSAKACDAGICKVEAPRWFSFYEMGKRP